MEAGEATLRIRGRQILAKDGSWTSSESVFCPAKGQTVETSACKACVLAHSMSAHGVVCEWAGAPAPSGLAAPAASAALLHVTLVRADVPGAALLELARRTAWRLPIIDDDDRFLGFVSSKLLEGPHGAWHRLTVILAREVASGASLAVQETEPMGRVLRIMARSGTRSVALINPLGVLRGVLSDVDALRAVAHSWPPPPKK